MSSKGAAKRIEEIWRKRKPELICGVLCLIVIGALTRVLIRRSLYIETENATLQGYAIALSAEVEGEVLRVFVEENQAVRKGQLLCVLEDSRWIARLNAAEADQAALRARWEAARRDEARLNFLARRNAASLAARDHASALAESLFRRMKAAKARVFEARTNERRTRVAAPSDGIIAFRTARPGMLAQKGMPLFGFVDNKDRWVLAKVRETDLPDLHVGKPVKVEFDAIPGREFSGKIESVSPATERPFYSAIPADFSAGNFTKYVQWHPIRIRLAPNELAETDEARIPIGISSEVHMSRD